MDLFVAQNITKQYGNYTALNDVSINVPQGSVFGLLGPNGAGKTSLIRIINQITAPDTGELIFNGEKLKPEHVAQIGYLPEERGLYKKMKVGEQAMYLAQLKGLSTSEAKARLKEWFLKFGMETWWDKKVDELSKGMAQKVQFVVTVLHNPKLLIFDEPFSGFDPINTNLIKNEIRELNKKGATIIFSTHRMESVEEICNHIALINKSNKILDGPLEDIRNQYRTNTFEIEYNGMNGELHTKLPESYTVVDMELPMPNKIQVKLPEGKTPNDLLAALLPHTQVQALNEVIPSVNDIFIRTVENA